MKLERLLTSAKSRILSGSQPTTKEVVELTSIIKKDVKGVFSIPSSLAVSLLELLFDSQFPSPEDSLLKEIVGAIPIKMNSYDNVLMLVLVLWNYHVPQLDSVVKMLQDATDENLSSFLLIVAVGAQLEYLTTQDKQNLPQALLVISEAQRWKSQKLVSVFNFMTGIYHTDKAGLIVERAVLVQHALYWIRDMLPIKFTSTLLNDESTHQEFDLLHWSGNFLYSEVSRVINWVTLKYPDVVRKLKVLDEDAQMNQNPQGKNLFKSSVHIRNTLDSAGSSLQSLDDVQQPENADSLLCQLLKLLTDICYCYPELSRELLAHKRRAFMRTCYDEKVLDFSGRARYYVLLGVCSRDVQSAQMIYDYMSGPTSISSAISWEYLFAALDHYVKEFKNVTATNSEVIRSEDVLLLRSLLYLLTEVVIHCSVARFTMYSNGGIINKLFNLLVTHVPSDLKASLLEAISAFLSTDAVSVQDSFTSMAQSVWQTIETAQILPQSMQGGIVYDLEVCESREHWYSETIAFLQLLSTVLRAPVEVYQLYDTLSFQTRHVETLNLPSLAKYVNFVLDVVFVKADQRTYNDIQQKYEVQSKSLQFIEIALFGYPSEASLLVAQKLLTGNSIYVEKVLNLLVQGVSKKLPVSLINHALRVLLRLFDVQDAVVQQSKGIHLISMQEVMAKQSDAVAALASFLRYDTSGDDESCYLSILLFHRIQQSPLFSQRLVSILRQSKDHQVVMDSVSARLAEEDLVQQFPLTSAGPQNILSWINLIRYSFAHLLLLQSDMSPSAGHLLLGFDTMDMSATEFKKGSKLGFQVLVDIMLDVVDALQSGSDNYDELTFAQWPANLRHPEFLSDVLETLVSLCRNISTSEVSIRYLRYKGLFHKLIQLLTQPIVYSAEYKDRFVGYQLTQKRFAQMLLALELNVALITKDQNLQASLVGGLLSTQSLIENFTDDVQSCVALQVLQNLVSVELQMTVEQPQIKYTKSIDLQPYRQVDEEGREFFDVSGVSQVLNHHLQQLVISNGQVSNNHELELATTEIKQLTLYLSAKNELASLVTSRMGAIEGWKQLIHLSVGCFHQNVSTFMLEVVKVLKAAELYPYEGSQLAEVVLACSVQRLECDEFDQFELCKLLQQAISASDRGMVYRGNMYVALRNVAQNFTQIKLPFSDSLTKVLLDDLASSMDSIWKTTAMSLLGKFMKCYEPSDRSKLLQEMESRNVVRSLVGELLSVDDLQLLEMFSGSAHNATCLFQFQSRMSLLLSVGQASQSLLLSNGIVEALADLKFIKARSDQFAMDTEDFSDILQACYSLVIQLASVVCSQQPAKLKFFISKQSENFMKYLTGFKVVTVPQLTLVRSILRLLKLVKFDSYPDVQAACNALAVQFMSRQWIGQLQPTNEEELLKSSTAVNLVPYSFVPVVTRNGFHGLDSKLISQAKLIVFDIVQLCVYATAKQACQSGLKTPVLQSTLQETSSLSIGGIFSLYYILVNSFMDGQVVQENVTNAVNHPSSILWDDLVALSSGDSSQDSSQLRQYAQNRLQELQGQNQKEMKKVLLLLEQCLIILRHDLSVVVFDKADKEELIITVKELVQKSKDVSSKQFQGFLQWVLPQLQL